MKKKIAIQGIEGSFHHLAALNFFDEERIEIVPCSTFHEEIQLVHEGKVDACIMAMENTLAGNLVANYQLLQESQLFISGEITMHIRQHLIGRPGQAINDITEVHSHPVALNQCRHYLRKLNGIKLVENEDTAQSVKNLQTSDKSNIAAIGGRLASDMYGMEVLKTNIELHYDNYTRFIVLSENRELTEEEDKVSVYFQLKHSVGSLSSVLTKLSNMGVNLSMIHSMPIPKQDWEYGFFVTFNFTGIELKEEALRCIEQDSDRMDVLGVYKKGFTVWE